MTEDEIKARVDEYQAKAMLLGMIYDIRDHTINKLEPLEHIVFDADTLEQLKPYSYVDRLNDIQNNRAGPEWLRSIRLNVRQAMWQGELFGGEIP